MSSQIPLTTLSILTLYLSFHICVFAAPHPGSAVPKRSAASKDEERANSLDLNDRYMSKAKKWYEEGNGDNLLLAAHPPASAFLESQPSMMDAPTGFGFGTGMGGGAPFLPDKWGDLFLAQQQRSFLPYNNMGVEKRRRASDDKQQQFLDNYLNLVEPGRFEWNLNRL